MKHASQLLLCSLLLIAPLQSYAQDADPNDPGEDPPEMTAEELLIESGQVKFDTLAEKLDCEGGTIAEYEKGLKTIASKINAKYKETANFLRIGKQFKVAMNEERQALLDECNSLRDGDSPDDGDGTGDN